MREEFEKLPEIATHLAHGNVFYSEEKSAYASEFSALHFVACYVNGAWMAWQEQQKRIDACENLLAKWRSKGLVGSSDYARGGLHSRQDCEDELEQALKGDMNEQHLTR